MLPSFIHALAVIGAAWPRLRLAARVGASVLAATLLTLASVAEIRAAPEADTQRVSLEAARQQLTDIQQRIDAADEHTLLQLREKALQLQAELQHASADLEPQLAQVAARGAELRAKPEQANESKDVASQRHELEQTRGKLEGQLKLANLLALEADQTVGKIAARSRAQFRERLGDRTRSPLERAFWTELRADAPEDAQRVKAFGAQVRDTLARSEVIPWLGALLITVVTLVLRWQLARDVLHVQSPASSQGSLRALSSVILWTLSAALIAAAVALAVFNSDGGPAPAVAGLLSGVGAAVTFAIYVGALGPALLSLGGAHRRTPRLPKEVRARLRRFSVQLAAVIMLVGLVGQLASAINVSPTLSVALDALTTLVLGVTLARGIRRTLGGYAQVLPGPASAETGPAPAALPFWVGTLLRIGWFIVVAGLICLLVGYVALGSFVIQQFAWAVIVLATAYLLARVVDDVLMTLATTQHAPQSRAAPARIRIATLLSALVRVAIALFALSVLLAPFGAGAIDLLPQLSRLREGVSIGAIRLRPMAVARGLLILALGLLAVRILKDWTLRRYLPLTRLEPGMRESITSLVGYAGYCIVVGMALSAMGVGLQQIAWVVSALALGIGFGLQAIVQNFVSGLILLAERPIRVGDWVALDGFEGDVRRINARATEIERLDRSTVIVPNSEFITKVVRNITYDNPLGQVQIKLPVPLGADVERVRAELLRAFQAHSEILREPEPTVSLDVIEWGNVLFNARGFVSSPRAVSRVRSAILFDALVRLKKANIPVGALNPQLASTLFSLSMVLLLAATSACAQDVSACFTIDDDTARLSCYDNLSGRAQRKPPPQEETSRLRYRWEQRLVADANREPFSLQPYQPTYALFTYHKSFNYAPYRAFDPADHLSHSELQLTTATTA